MKQLLIIPDVNNIKESIMLAKEYQLGFEYNDFFVPDILDDKDCIDSIIKEYMSAEQPGYCTVHGAFFDVIPFSLDKKIRDIAFLRIEQSIEVAKQIGAKAVVFHTNYNPFLNTPAYIENFIKENTLIWEDILKKHSDINIYLENMFDTTPYILSKMAEYLSKYDNFGICLDYAHACISDCKLQEWVEKLGKYTKHIHINDNDLISDLHLAWGEGKIDRNEFYELYNKYMNTATVLIETSALDGQKKSLQTMKEDGFI